MMRILQIIRGTMTHGRFLQFFSIIGLILEFDATVVAAFAGPPQSHLNHNSKRPRCSSRTGGMVSVVSRVPTTIDNGPLSLFAFHHPDLFLTNTITLPSLFHSDLIANGMMISSSSTIPFLPSPTSLLIANDAAETAAAAAAATDANAALDALGRDIFIFLAASVAVVPISRTINISPVLGFLLIGCTIGPYGLGLLSSTDADFQLGDFGILFLLFAEGLTLSKERIDRLTTFSTLGILQILISAGFLFFGILQAGPFLLQRLEQAGIPLDDRLLRPILSSPVEAFCIAAACTLSSSAFVLPILKQKNWEDLPEGVAGLSILLLQDLAVAPLLIALPLLAGSGPQSSAELGLLAAKATVGFGVVLYVGSTILRFVFEFVAAARSTETFVAAVLLVALGMGMAAEWLGLSASTGAFAAGVLLASNKYRAQIQADIKPFEGILLGVFFMTAGATLDPQVVIKEWPTLLTGILTVVTVKAGIVFLEGPVLGLTKGQAARIALTVAGGGEFAFVVFKLAEDLGLLPDALVKTLTAAVILSMSLTPLLGEAGALVGDYLDSLSSDDSVGFGTGLSPEEAESIFDDIDTDNSGTIELDELRIALLQRKLEYVSIAEIFTAFDTNNDGVISKEEWRLGLEAGIFEAALLASKPIAENSSGSSGGNTYNNNNGDKKEESPYLSFSDDAIVVCGYGELGKPTLKMLEAEWGSGNIVAFDLNPSRVADGILAGAPVVYGDGAKIDLFRATGVKTPKAVVITYASRARVLEATTRLRLALPADTPIYSRAGSINQGLELMDAGATDVIVGMTEEVLRFGELLGLCDSPTDEVRLRQRSFDATRMKNANKNTNNNNEDVVPGLSEEAVRALAAEIGCTRDEFMELHSMFSSLTDDGDGKADVPISDLRDMLMRIGAEPVDDSVLTFCLELENEDGEGKLSFTEFVRAIRDFEKFRPDFFSSGNQRQV